jgi:hypothetical protein
MSDKKKMDTARLEFVARITMPDGKVIERRVAAADTIPAPDDFDTSSTSGFLDSFDVLEQATLEARNRIAQEITEAFLDEVSKKTKSEHH